MNQIQTVIYLNVRLAKEICFYNSYIDITKSRGIKNEGEIWTQPSGRKVTKKNGEIIPVGITKKRIFQKLPENYKAKKNDIIQYVENIIAGKFPKLNYLPIRKVQKYTKQRIKSLTGVDVTDFAHALDYSSVRKILKSHGDTKSETSRGQLPINKKDFSLIPEIVDTFDEISLKGDKRKNVITIEYKKEINGVYFYLEEIRTGSGTLVPITMYKRKEETNL